MITFVRDPDVQFFTFLSGRKLYKRVYELSYVIFQHLAQNTVAVVFDISIYLHSINYSVIWAQIAPDDSTPSQTHVPLES